jgi:hypothetical protein
MAKTHNRSKKVKRNVMKGGNLTQDNEHYLIEQGFTQDQINTLNENNVSMDSISQAIDEYQTNPHELIVTRARQIYESNNLNVSTNSSNMSSLHASDLMGNNHENDVIPHDPEDQHELDMSNDLGNTTLESFGDDEQDMMNQSAGSRKTKKRRHRMKKSKRRKSMKGGRCYGNGVGANSYDPNYSIYNTNMLKLFPYK